MTQRVRHSFTVFNMVWNHNYNYDSFSNYSTEVLITAIRGSLMMNIKGGFGNKLNLINMTQMWVKIQQYQTKCWLLKITFPVSNAVWGLHEYNMRVIYWPVVLSVCVLVPKTPPWSEINRQWCMVPIHRGSGVRYRGGAGGRGLCQIQTSTEALCDYWRVMSCFKHIRDPLRTECTRRTRTVSWRHMTSESRHMTKRHMLFFRHDEPAMKCSFCFPITFTLDLFVKYGHRLEEVILFFLAFDYFNS